MGILGFFWGKSIKYIVESDVSTPKIGSARLKKRCPRAALNLFISRIGICHKICHPIKHFSGRFNWNPSQGPYVPLPSAQYPPDDKTSMPGVFQGVLTQQKAICLSQKLGTKIRNTYLYSGKNEMIQ